MDRGEKPFIKAWGVQSAPAWSPDGRKIAFVSTRTDHSFIVVYDLATRTVMYMAPSVDFDANPDVDRRRQEPRVRAPAGPAVRPAGAAGHGRRWGCPTARHSRRLRPRRPGAAADAAARGRGQGGGAAATAPAAASSPGLMRATFKGGYTLVALEGGRRDRRRRTRSGTTQPDDLTIRDCDQPACSRATTLVFRFNASAARRRRARRAGGAGRRTDSADDRRVGSVSLAEPRRRPTRSRCCSRRPTA